MIFRFLMEFGGPFWYPFLLAVTALCCAAAGTLLLRVKKDDPARFGRISRWKIPGMILGCIDLLWCVPHAAVILPENWQKLLVPAVIVFAALSWWCLDHLFSRAAGAWMILTAHLFLRESFADPVFLYPVFAFLTLIFGTLGIFIAGEPYRFRSLIASGAGRFRLILPVFCFVYALFLAGTFLGKVTGL